MDMFHRRGVILSYNIYMYIMCFYKITKNFITLFILYFLKHNAILVMELDNKITIAYNVFKNLIIFIKEVLKKLYGQTDINKF